MQKNVRRQAEIQYMSKHHGPIKFEAFEQLFHVSRKTILSDVKYLHETYGFSYQTGINGVIISPESFRLDREYLTAKQEQCLEKSIEIMIEKDYPEAAESLKSILLEFGSKSGE